MTKSLLSILLLLTSLPTFAEEEKPWWKFWPSEQQQTAIEETSTEIKNQLFTKEERSILQGYLGKSAENKEHQDDDLGKKDKKAKKQKALPPGLKKKVERGGELPPGWQMKVQRGEVLDDDLYLASKGLPQDILDQLPGEPDGTTIRQIEDTVVRVIEATGVILDVLQGNVGE
jgi:hypothetical protein